MSSSASLGCGIIGAHGTAKSVDFIIPTCVNVLQRYQPVHYQHLHVHQWYIMVLLSPTTVH